MTAQPLEADTTTRQRVLALVVSDGPVSVAEIASRLSLTAAGVRRHMDALDEAGMVEVHAVRVPDAGRGRPARRYVATARGQGSLPTDYSRLAADVLGYLREEVGSAAVADFAQRRLADLEQRYASVVTAPDVSGRATQLAQALCADGYVATVRPAPGGHAVQLCQGHCPVQHVAEEFPELCEAETQVFSRLVGTHIQRLVTQAAGGHVCTTNIPVGLPDPVVGPDGAAAHTRLVTTSALRSDRSSMQ